MEEEITTNEEDKSSFSNFDEIIQTNADLEISLDFDKRQLKGEVEYQYNILNLKLSKIVLDLYGPRILSVNYITEDEEIIPLKYEIYDKHKYKKILGTPLIIFLSDFKSNYESEYNKCIDSEKMTISIEFITSEFCNGIQFLTKEQTNSKNYPFMFTQCEPIYCRSLFPCQDSPNIKSTYSVKTLVDKPLLFLFNGIIKSHYFDCGKNKKIMTFEQNIPIPSYLISFVAGELEFGKVSNRVEICTEKGLNISACQEFIETERYIEILEKYLNYPFEWKKFTIVVLPFSFPYGGLENPNMTFVTSSLIAGDKSLSNIIGDLLCYCWTSNLVTNKNWDNFWINASFTKFLQRKLTKILYGDDMVEFDSMVGNNNLLSAIKIYGENSNFTSLNINMEGVDPGTAFSVVTYEKGFQFFLFLEKKIGEEHFKNILHDYIKIYKYQSVDYTAFKEVYEEYIKNNFDKNEATKKLSSINWDKWINEKGYPSFELNYSPMYMDEINNLLDKFLEGNENEEDVKLFQNWHTNIKLVFLEEVYKQLDNIDIEIIKRMKVKLMLAENYNCEIKAYWYNITLKKKMDEEISNIKKFLQTNGRIKYLQPLYLAWMEYDFKEAKNFFDENKYLYHSITCKLIQDKFEKK